MKAFRAIFATLGLAVMLVVGALSSPAQAGTPPVPPSGQISQWQVRSDNPDAVVAVVASPSGIQSATSCSYNAFGQQQVCLYVEGSGLYVAYAVVTNVSVGGGRAFISTTYNGYTWNSTSKIYPGQSWRKDFGFYFNDGNKICGSIEGLNGSCLYITA